MHSFLLMKEGMRMFGRSLRARALGFRKLGKDAEDICRESVERCWNGKYFMASSGHFREFYVRDFGFCAESLMKLGHRDKVLKTLEYALGVFEKHNKTTTSINPGGKPFDFPAYGVDTLPLLVHSLKIADAKGIIDKHRSIITDEIVRFYSHVIDPSTGLVRQDRNFSSVKDHALRKSSCYGNSMVGMMASDLEEMGLENPFARWDYRRLIEENLWQGEYFLDDLGAGRYVAGDANLFPFWTGLFDDKEMLRSVISSVSKEGLDRPFPLKYTKDGYRGCRMIKESRLAPDYETDSIWTHIGLLYAGIVKKADKRLFGKYMESYTDLIEKYGTFIEVFDRNGLPYHSLFYYADEGMLWAANYLVLR